VKLRTNVRELDGVGDATASKLRRLDIDNVRDLLLHIPRSYRDYSKITKIEQIQPGMVTLQGQISGIHARRSRRRHQSIVEATLEDDSGRVGLIWFNQPFRAQQLKQFGEVYISGELTIGDKLQLINPEVEPVNVDQSFTAKIVPQYPLTKGLSNKKLYRLTKQVVGLTDELDDYLSDDLRSGHGVMALSDAVRQLHRPDSSQQLAKAKQRWAFDELFDLILAARVNAQRLHSQPGVMIKQALDEIKEFLAQLPFTLTGDQKRALWQIIQDMSSGQPMNRLLQGDVGSGKTVVAAAAALDVIQSGHQVAIIAPTEVVARQHLRTIEKLLPDVDTALLTSSVTTAAKRRRKNKLAGDEAQLVVGTHAVLQPDVEFASLGLLVIDEQHRFGVKQRQQLVAEGESLPHVLSMSATPIPRTLALSVYSDLDVTSIRELPPGRKPVETAVYGPKKRQFVYDRITEQLVARQQVYVVCPLISDSDKLGVTSVEREYRRIADYFKTSDVAQLHGALTPDDKQVIIDRFVSGEVDILVATTVVEVGVDVANATVMLIEGAERFGLSQLHQLRGRVGRSDKQSYAYALTSTTAQARNPRLQAFADTTDGFELAEYDMEHRGSGQLWGTAQSGQFTFKHAHLGDTRLVEQVQAVVADILADEDLLQAAAIQSKIDNAPRLAHRN